ncbi:MAG: GGDEF domain-containing protein [Burkholderiaceae bacterium]
MSQLAAWTLFGLANAAGPDWHGARAAQGEWTLRFLLLGLLTLIATVAREVSGSFAGALPLQANEFILPAGSLLAALMVATALVQRLYSRERLLKYAQASVMETHRSITEQLAENVRARTFELQMANEQLARVTRVDGLTGVFNRRHFDESIANAVITARAGGKQLAIMMIDLDFFKKLNDEHGHAAGDLCLIEAGRQATDCVPEGIGLVARYGGEEFVALLPDTRPGQAAEIAESIRWHIEEARPEHNGKILTMTASIGLWCGQPAPDSTPGSLLELADAALYRAKREGRNRVIEHEPGFADPPARADGTRAPAAAPADEPAPPAADDAVFETDPPATAEAVGAGTAADPTDPAPGAVNPVPAPSGMPRGPRRARRLADIDL